MVPCLRARIAAITENRAGNKATPKESGRQARRYLEKCGARRTVLCSLQCNLPRDSHVFAPKFAAVLHLRLLSLWNRHREQSRDADLDAVQHGCTIPNSGDGIEAVDNHDLRLAGDVVPELPRPVVVRAAGKAGKMKRPPPQAGASAHLLCTIACRGPCSERGKLTSSSRRRIECNAAAATNRGVNVRSAFALPTAWPTTQPRTSADPSLI